MTEAEKIAPDIPALVTCRREMALAKTPAAQIAAMKRALTPLAVPVRHGFVNKTTVVDAVFEQADAIGLRNAVNDDVISIAITDALDPPPSEEPPIEPSDYGDVPDAHPAAPSVWRWHGEPEPDDLTDYLIRGLVPAQGVGLIAGQWGTFKTFAALDIAAAAITQTAFLGMPIERAGGVLFFAIEGQAEVTKRLTAALEARGHTEQIAPFAWTDTCPRLLDPRAGNKIAALIHDAAERIRHDWNLPVVLAIVDTAGKAAGFAKAGEENDTALNKVLMKNLAVASRATGAFVFGVDHFGKDASTGTRGASSKEDDADVVLALLGEKGLGGNVTNPRLVIRKRRCGPNGVEFPFTTRVVQAGEDATTLVIDWTTAQTELHQPRSKWPRSLVQFQRAIRDAIDAHGATVQPFGDGPSVRAVNREHVRAEFKRIYPVDGDTPTKRAEALKKAFQRAEKDAIARNLIACREADDGMLMWVTSP